MKNPFLLLLSSQVARSSFGRGLNVDPLTAIHSAPLAIGTILYFRGYLHRPFRGEALITIPLRIHCDTDSIQASSAVSALVNTL